MPPRPAILGPERLGVDQIPQSENMYEVYRDMDTAKVGMIDGILRESGIPTMLKNWTGGSNITSVPIPTLYPTIYVLDIAQVDEAKKQIAEFFEAKPEVTEDWNCQHCGEIVDGFLGECWSCQQPKAGE